MNNNNNNANKDIVWRIASLIVPIVCVFLTYFLTNASAQSTIVKRLAVNFDFVDKTMSFEQALQAVYEESKQKEELINELKKQDFISNQEKDDIINSLNQQINELNEHIVALQDQISNAPNLEFVDSTLISDGLKIQDRLNKSLIVVDNTKYYSEGLLNLLLKNRFLYDPAQNTVFYNSSGENISSETKIDLFNTNVLYDGVCYGTYLPSEGRTFSMGSTTYNKGFVIYDDHSLFGDGDGYALFDLQGKYSKMTFDVGRTNEHEKQDVILKVYLNGEYSEEYSLSGQSPPISLEITLNYANNLKLEITGGTRVKYGFANVILNYWKFVFITQKIGRGIVECHNFNCAKNDIYALNLLNKV